MALPAEFYRFMDHLNLTIFLYSRLNCPPDLFQPSYTVIKNQSMQRSNCSQSFFAEQIAIVPTGLGSVESAEVISCNFADETDKSNYKQIVKLFPP